LTNDLARVGAARVLDLVIAVEPRRDLGIAADRRGILSGGTGNVDGVVTARQLHDGLDEVADVLLAAESLADVTASESNWTRLNTARIVVLSNRAKR
jgi:hypothetical protein